MIILNTCTCMFKGKYHVGCVAKIASMNILTLYKQGCDSTKVTNPERLLVGLGLPLV